MSLRAVQQPRLTGAAVVYTVNSAGGDSFQNDGATSLMLKNTTGGAITVTINSVNPCDQGFDHDVVVVVAAGAEVVVGPFDIIRFGNLVTFTYSVDGISVAVVRNR